jgi:hypothetical protein
VKAKCRVFRGPCSPVMRLCSRSLNAMAPFPINYVSWVFVSPSFFMHTFSFLFSCWLLIPPFLDQFGLNFVSNPCVVSPKGPKARDFGSGRILGRSEIRRFRPVLK